jgi:CRISPR-associated protein Cas2
MDVVVAYDIADTQSAEGSRRLRAVAAVCSGYGTRVQFSVFECRVSPDRYVAMISDLSDAIDDGDSVVIYRMTGPISSSRTQLGRAATRALGEPWLF